MGERGTWVAGLQSALWKESSSRKNQGSFLPLLKGQKEEEVWSGGKRDSCAPWSRGSLATPVPQALWKKPRCPAWVPTRAGHGPPPGPVAGLGR